MATNSTIRKKKKRPLSVHLSAALILALITFFVGYLIPSVFALDARIKSAQEEITKLEQQIKDDKAEIKELKSAAKEKDDANVALGNKIAEHLQTIEALNVKIKELESDVDFAAEAAMNGDDISDSQLTKSVSRLSSGQQLVIIVALFILLIFVISVTCGIIAAVKGAPEESDKSRRKKKRKKNDDEDEDEDKDEDEPLEKEVPEAPVLSAPAEETPSDEEPAEEPQSASILTTINEAISLLYTNKLEDGMADIGGFKFGVTNFEEILSDTAMGKSFGNSESGDFVAFMDEEADEKKLFIIPRYMTLSDSTVSLRGTVDLFDIIDENNNEITHGTVKIKTVTRPAVFAFGSDGWAIDSKGIIRAYNSEE